MRKDVVERLSTVHVIVVGPEQARAQAVVEVLLRQAAAEAAGNRGGEHDETKLGHADLWVRAVVGASWYKGLE